METLNHDLYELRWFLFVVAPSSRKIFRLNPEQVRRERCAAESGYRALSRSIALSRRGKNWQLRQASSRNRTFTPTAGVRIAAGLKRGKGPESGSCLINCKSQARQAIRCCRFYRCCRTRRCLLACNVCRLCPNIRRRRNYLVARRLEQ